MKYVSRRPLDRHVRFSIPGELRRTLGLNPGTNVEWLVGDGGMVAVRPLVSLRCRLCGRMAIGAGRRELHGYDVCGACIADLRTERTGEKRVG